MLPAVAVLRELRSREIPLETMWIGGTEGIEAEAARDEGIPFAAIPTGKLRRYLDRRTARDAVNIPRGVFAARKLVRDFKPDVVFSTGGFVSVPTVSSPTPPGADPDPRADDDHRTRHQNQPAIGRRTALSFEDRIASRQDSGQGGRHRQPDPNRAFGRGRCAGPAAVFIHGPAYPVLFVTGGARGASPLNQRIKAILPSSLETRRSSIRPAQRRRTPTSPS